MHNYTKTELTNLITGKLRRNFGRDVDEATVPQMFKACAMVLRDIMSAHELETEDRVKDSHARQVHYLSLEFLMGRSLMKNAYNLGVLEPLTQAILDIYSMGKEVVYLICSIAKLEVTSDSPGTLFTRRL